MRYGIRNKSTKNVMIIGYTMETYGREYHSYERPVFHIEEMDDVTTGMPIWTTDNKDTAENVLVGAYEGKETVAYPFIEKSWDQSGGRAEYEVFEIDLHSKEKKGGSSLSIERLMRGHATLSAINPGKPVTVIALSKEVSSKSAAALAFINENHKHFKTDVVLIGKTKHLTLTKCFAKASDNPEAPEYLPQRILENEKTIKIEYYDNYGHVSGYYIEPSKGALEAQYLNTKEKIEGLRDALSLKPAVYHLGGFGDSAVIRPEHGYGISHSQLCDLVDQGWTVIGEFLPEPSSKRGQDYDRSKITKKGV